MQSIFAAETREATEARDSDNQRERERETIQIAKSQGQTNKVIKMFKPPKGAWVRWSPTPTSWPSFCASLMRGTGAEGFGAARLPIASEGLRSIRRELQVLKSLIENRRESRDFKLVDCSFGAQMGTATAVPCRHVGHVGRVLRAQCGASALPRNGGGGVGHTAVPGAPSRNVGPTAAWLKHLGHGPHQGGQGAEVRGAQGG